MIKKLLFVCFLFTLLFGREARATASAKILPSKFLAKPFSGVTTHDEKLYTSTLLNVSNFYPNPADNYIELDYTMQENSLDARITLRNVLGLVVGEYGLMPHGSKLHIDISHLSAGVYFYTLSLGNKNVATKKLLVRS
jgi:hypothetical protein